MTIYVGANTPSNFYVGGTLCGALYQGSTKLWPTVFSPIAYVYENGQSATVTIPSGATNMIAAAWGAGRNGTTGYRFGGGDGGDGGGYVESHFNVATNNGQTLSVFSAQANSSSNSTVTAGTFSMTQMVAGSGQGNMTGGGNATGGNYANILGTAGQAGEDGSTGAGGSGGTGHQANIGGTWYKYGYGGRGNDAAISQPTPEQGKPGGVVIYFS